MLVLLLFPADADGSRSGGFLSNRNAELEETTAKMVMGKVIMLCIILCVMWVWHSHDAEKGKGGIDAVLYCRQISMQPKL